jgi:TonB family protein
MNGALIYRPNSRKLTWFAFTCAISIHVAAVGLANGRSQNFVPVVCPSGGEIEAMDFPNSPQEEPDIVPPEQFPVNEDFSEEIATRPPIRPHTKTPVAAVSRPAGISTARTIGFGSAKALTLFAPKPNYPYEARRGGVTGTGVAQLKVSSAAGNVIYARMSQSTGSAILDNSTLTTLKRWRFKLGVAENVDVPVTYTLAGVSY